MFRGRIPVALFLSLLLKARKVDAFSIQQQQGRIPRVLQNDHLRPYSRRRITTSNILLAAASSTLSKSETQDVSETAAAIDDNKKEELDSIALSSVHRPPASSLCDKSDPSLWDSLVPQLWDNPRGVDVRIRWLSKSMTDDRGGTVNSHKDDDELAYFEQIAATFLDQIEKQRQHLGQQRQNDSQQRQQRLARQRELAASLRYFTEFCDRHLVATTTADNERHEFAARIVASRGPVSTKCPSWHQDHVPIRWIQALTGPGCQWIDPNDLTRNDLDYNDDNDKDDDDDDNLFLAEDIAARNRRLVDPSITPQQAAPGEAVMLMGQRWDEFVKTAVAKEQGQVNDDDDGEGYSSRMQSSPSKTAAVVHKSPDGTKPWQGRVLLTMDVAVPPLDDFSSS